MWDFFAPLFSTFSIVSFSGATIATLIAVFVGVPFIRRWAIVAAGAFLLVYFVHNHGEYQGAARKAAEWAEANRMAEIVAAEHDAENYNKTREEKERILAEIDKERAEFRKEIDRLVQDRKQQPGHCRIPDDLLDRLRRLARNPAARP